MVAAARAPPAGAWAITPTPRAPWASGEPDAGPSPWFSSERLSGGRGRPSLSSRPCGPGAGAPLPSSASRGRAWERARLPATIRLPAQGSRPAPGTPFPHQAPFRVKGPHPTWKANVSGANTLSRRTSGGRPVAPPARRKSPAPLSVKVSLAPQVGRSPLRLSSKAGGSDSRPWHPQFSGRPGCLPATAGTEDARSSGAVSVWRRGVARRAGGEGRRRRRARALWRSGARDLPSWSEI